VNWTNGYSGIANVTVSATNECGETVASPGFAMTVYSTEGISDPNNPLNVRLYPNPSNGRFILELNAITPSVYNLKIVNTLNNLVYEKQNLKVDGQINNQIDLSYLSDGVYYLIIESKNVHSTFKIIFQK
jgi:hypothetical protein